MLKKASSLAIFVALLAGPATGSAQTWQQSGPVCLPQPPSLLGLSVGPEVIVTKHADGVSPHFSASALRLSAYPKDFSQIKLYCNVNRQPCAGNKCFGVHISGIGITKQPNGSARVFVAGWNDNRNNGKDYYFQLLAHLPEGGVIGPMP